MQSIFYKNKKLKQKQITLELTNFAETLYTTRMKNTENGKSLLPINKHSVRKMSIDSIITTKNQSNLSLSSIHRSIHTSPLILNKHPLKEDNNIALPSISVLTNQLSNKSENTAFESSSKMKQYRQVSPISESKIRSTMERSRSFSVSNRDSQYFDVNGTSFDNTFFQPLLPPSAIPIGSSQGSFTDHRNPFTNKRRGSLNTSNNILSTPATFPSLVFPTPFLNSQSPLIFPSTFTDGNLSTNNALNIMTPRFSNPDILVSKNRGKHESEDGIANEVSLNTRKESKVDQIRMNYNIKKAMSKEITKVQNPINNDEQNLDIKEFDKGLSPLEVPKKCSNKVSKVTTKKKKEKKKKKQQLQVLADIRTDNRQRLGSSCNLCQLKKCKCNAKIEVVIQDEKLFKLNEEIQGDSENAKLHFMINMSSRDIVFKLKEWMRVNGINVPKEFEVSKSNNICYYKHLNKIIKITSCIHCQDHKVGCFFKYGYSKDDKRLCYKLNLKVKNTYLMEKRKLLKGNISELPSESCYLNKLTVVDYYKCLGL